MSHRLIVLAALVALLTVQAPALAEEHAHAAHAAEATAEAELTEANGYEITVYKSQYCGCCKQWIKHLESNGFLVNAVDSDDMTAIKDEYGVPKKLASCHTARVDGYTVEGHVPAADILRLLKERPRAEGLTVPGMPVGSPGMEVGDRVDPYSVFLFTGADKEVWSAYGQADDTADDS
ncbi:MAG: DUF411 domain-containing protein [Pseudomonadota bacterium]